MNKKKDKVVYFFQDSGTYPGETLVACGFENYKELIKELRLQKEKGWADALHFKGDESENPHYSRWCVFKCTHEEKGCNKCEKSKGIYYMLLWLPDWKKDVEHYSVLGHEIVHGCTFMLRDKLDMVKENEAFAYQFTYLFDSITSRLAKYF